MTPLFDTSFEDYWRATRERLDDEFERTRRRFFDRLPASHLATIRAVLAGGKRLRGCLVCLLNDSLGGTRAAAVPRAMAVECVHAASLIHDDLIDGDTSRRNRPATWTTEGQRRAVLLADLMFATALQRMVELSPDDGLTLAEAIATMATGAYQEPLVPTDLRGFSQDKARLYPELIYLKTGVLFGTASRMGALAAGVSAPLAAHAFEYGARTGEAYQIADDLQDLVERAADQTPTPAQLSLLAPAVWHFCADLAPESSSLTPDHAARLRPQLRSAMLAAIEVRLQQAMAAANQLPSGPCDVLLATAPRHIVRAMSLGAP
ncbi:polyprenyl synthetase family protein [Ramlibacter henchirensis]|uniref:Polyprenyl synthetase family protein n=1 Tax=Ramlibacter henchirensis TaxID=204072 RepID=A0A4Z0BUU3_9BURK|nr:polyprenyl synthetase family protein [Ramlibacter henchirensis]TFZ03086.1 polyprenyl synthetase family protein [Ramlibacter henchirensis]